MSARQLLPHGWRAPTIDGVSLLSLYLFLVFAIPSRLVIAPLGGAGSPALLIGFVALLWWAWIRVRTASLGVVEPPLPVTRTAGLFVAAVLASYVVATSRPIAADELNTATLGIVSVLGWVGLLLLAAQGTPTRQRIEVLIDRIVLGGGLLALLGLLQFFTHQSYVDRIQIPGLSTVQTFYGVQSREGFTRPSGTAIHPIEFGVVLTTVLPLALGRALGGGRLGIVRRSFPAVAILLAITLSVSRSALVCAAVGVLVTIPSWPRQARRLAALAMVAVGGLVFVFVPGMLGSTLGLFTGIGTDTSARSRIDSYGVAVHYFLTSPVFGRGFATFLPKYRIFDNEYLLLGVEIGAVGVLALGFLIGSSMLCARRAVSRELGDQGILEQSLVGSVAAVASSLALFDAFSFPMVPGLMFLLMGIGGALLRTSRRSAAAENLRSRHENQAGGASAAVVTVR